MYILKDKEEGGGRTYSEQTATLSPFLSRETHLIGTLAERVT
jgi:hypothetical protein